MRYKTQSEFQVIDFNSKSYNKPFTLDELSFCLSNSKDTSPGEDQIYYKMIKHMSDKAKQHLVDIFNKFYRWSFFSTQWNTAIVTTIPKPDKDHSIQANYRPIALTSCLCQTFERLVNERLLDYLEANCLATYSVGAGKIICTTDHLVRIENPMRTGFAKGEHLIFIFFDIEKVYDMSWRYGV